MEILLLVLAGGVAGLLMAPFLLGLIVFLLDRGE
jgi:hypothetical protein